MPYFIGHRRMQIPGPTKCLHLNLQGKKYKHQRSTKIISLVINVQLGTNKHQIIIKNQIIEI